MTRFPISFGRDLILLLWSHNLEKGSVNLKSKFFFILHFQILHVLDFFWYFNQIIIIQPPFFFFFLTKSITKFFYCFSYNITTCLVSTFRGICFKFLFCKSILFVWRKKCCKYRRNKREKLHFITIFFHVKLLFNLIHFFFFFSNI